MFNLHMWLIRGKGEHSVSVYSTHCTSDLPPVNLNHSVPLHQTCTNSQSIQTISYNGREQLFHFKSFQDMSKLSVWIG